MDWGQKNNKYITNIGSIFLQQAKTFDIRHKNSNKKEKIYKMDFIKTKNFFSSRKNIKIVERQITELGMVFIINISNKELISRIYLQKRMNRFFNGQERYQSLNKRGYPNGQ